MNSVQFDCANSTVEGVAYRIDRDAEPTYLSFSHIATWTGTKIIATEGRMAHATILPGFIPRNYKLALEEFERDHQVKAVKVTLVKTTTISVTAKP